MSSLKENLVKNLNATYCRLKPSKLGGIGVFAIRDIPKKMDPFAGINEPRWLKINLSELKNLDKEILKMIDDFFVIEKNEDILIPSFGLNGMDISFFLNHSENPNVERLDDGSFITNREIKKDEELFVSYGTYDHKWKK